MPTKYLTDGVLELSLGMNAGDLPQILERGEAAYILNGEISNGFMRPRPAYNKVAITGTSGDIAASTSGRFYGCCGYTSDAGVSCILASIAGQLYRFTPQYDSNGSALNSVLVDNQTGNTPGQSTASNVTQHWLIQAERWVIWNDGVSLPIFWDGSASPPNARVSLGQNIPYGESPELGAGKMLAYGLGQVWEALPDGYSFLFSDPVYYSSGSSQFNFRDSVLKLKINSTIIEGGNFRVPTPTGQITGLTFTALLDATLGTGPLQVFTQQAVYGCVAPEVPISWLQSETPLLTASLMGAGGASPINAQVNGDIFFRSSDGQIRSLFMGRRDFQRWGNTPVSFEVSPFLQSDPIALLPFCGTFEFDNDVLTMANPVNGPLGVYCQNLVCLSLDQVSGIDKSTNPAYNGLWNIGNVLGMVVWTFNGVERCFAFVFNTVTDKIELRELLTKGSSATADASVIPIQSQFISGALFWQQSSGTEEWYKGGNQPSKSVFDLIKLEGGTVAAQSIVGKVTFLVEYKSVYDTNWHQWYTWTVDNTKGDSGYQPNMGLGSPPDEDNLDTERLTCVDYSFQVRITITGSCRFMGIRLFATIQPQPELEPPFVQE